MPMETALSASIPAIMTCLPMAAARDHQLDHQRPPDALAAAVHAHVHAVLHGVPVAGPGAKLAEGAEAG